MPADLSGLNLTENFLSGQSFPFREAAPKRLISGNIIYTFSKENSSETGLKVLPTFKPCPNFNINFHCHSSYLRGTQAVGRNVLRINSSVRNLIRPAPAFGCAPLMYHPMNTISSHFSKTCLVARLVFTMFFIGMFTTPAQSAIVYIGSASGANNALPTNRSPGTLTIAKPAGTVAGQVLIASIAARPSGMTVTVPTGWNVMTVTNQPDGGTSTLPGGMTLLTYYHIVGTAEPASYDWTFANTAGSGPDYGGSAVGGILAFSGVDTSNGSPIDAWSQKLTPSGLTHSTNPITTTVANTMIVSSISYLSGGSFAKPTGIAGLTERIDQRAPASTDAVGTTIQMSNVLQAAIGNSGASQAVAKADPDTGAGHLMALRPSTPDVAILMTRSTALPPGGTAFYTLNVSNNGILAEPGPISVINTLPAGLTYSAAGSGGTGWVCSVVGQVVTCTRAGALAAGGSAAPLVLNVNVSAAASGTITNTATVSGTGGDNNTVNNTAVDIYTFPTAASFECLETGSNSPWSAAARKPLYTKLVNTNFTIDIAAQKSDGTLESNYVVSGGSTKYVKVELFDDTTPPATCAAYASPVASQTVAFTPGVFSGTAGRTLTGNFNLGSAYRLLRCRVKECTSGACTSFTAVPPACSSDQFAVRPSAATLATAVMAAAPSASATPTIKAGANFTLSATTSSSASYAGALTLDTNKLTAQIPSQDTTLQSGGMVGTLTPSALTANTAAINASYSEAGFLYLAPGAYSDKTFTAVDSATGDCITSTANDNNLSDTLIGGKYGCDIGNKASLIFGRFIPDHFAISVPTLTAACSTSTPFSYFGQDGFTTTFTLTAQNAANGTTQNYSGVFAKLDLSNYARYGFSAAPLPTGSNLSSSATAPSGSWSNGMASVSAKHQISRPTALIGVTSIAVSAAPTDGEVPAAGNTTVGSATNMRYGRLRIQNAYGSELLDLPVSLLAQYWNGSAWVQNIDDSCTSIVAPSSGAGLIFYPEVAANVRGNHLSANETTATVSTTGQFAGGDGKLKLSKPGVGNSGYVDIAIVVPAWLKFPWNGAANTDPTARATFGIYKSTLIYLREMY